MYTPASLLGTPYEDRPETFLEKYELWVMIPLILLIGAELGAFLWLFIMWELRS